MGLLKLMNKKVIRIDLLRLKRTTNGLPAIKELIHPDDRSDKLNSNKRSKLETSSTKLMAQRCKEEISTPAPLLNFNLNCQTIELPKVILPQSNSVIEEVCKNKYNDVEIIDLCSSDED